MNTSAPEPKSQEAEVPSGTKNATLSPYVQSDDSSWNQSLLAKVLLQLKDNEVTKLSLTNGCYKPFEYEKWRMSMDRTMNGLHPEIGKIGQKSLRKLKKSISST